MPDIRIKSHPTFFVHGISKDEAERRARWLAERLAMLIEGSNDVSRVDHDIFRWQLGTNNDWRMRYDPETGELVVWYRYASPHCATELAALRTVIIWRLGWEDHNREAATTA